MGTTTVEVKGVEDIINAGIKWPCGSSPRRVAKIPLEIQPDGVSAGMPSGLAENSNSHAHANYIISALHQLVFIRVNSWPKKVLARN